MIDSWDGEIAWMKVDGNVVWTTMASSNSNTKTGKSKATQEQCSCNKEKRLKQLVILFGFVGKL